MLFFHSFPPDPQRRDAGGSVRRLPRVLHGRGAGGVDQTDGSGVLARDGGLHGCGLAPGVQLGGVTGWGGSGGEANFVCKGFRGRGFTDVDEIDICATL